MSQNSPDPGEVRPFGQQSAGRDVEYRRRRQAPFDEISVGGQVPTRESMSEKHRSVGDLAPIQSTVKSGGSRAFSSGRPSRRHRRLWYGFGHVKRCLIVRARNAMSAHNWLPGGCLQTPVARGGARPQRLVHCVADRCVACIGVPTDYSPKAHCESARARSCSGVAWLRCRILLR